MSRWFRHYAGMMRDDKLVRVAIRSKQTIERVVWVWGAILESAAEIDHEGRYDIDAAELAYFLRADQADVDAILAGLSDAGRVCETGVVKWGARQFASDRSKERVAAHRERKRAEVTRTDVPDGETSPNNVVTLQKRDRNAPETETELETDKKETSPNGDCASDDALTPDHVFEAWNDLAGRIAKPKIRDLTPERRQKVRARIAGYSLADWQAVLGAVDRSSFLRGETGWHGFTFDWMTKKGNFQKILEGNYDDKPSSSSARH